MGDMLAQSLDVVCACPNVFVPGENPPMGVLLRTLDVEGEGITGGGSAWIREYPAAKPCGKLCPGACACKARADGESALR